MNSLDQARTAFRARSTIGTISIALAAVALLLPFFVGGYFLNFATEVLIFAIFAMSLDILLGYTGLMSFGHAAFFGLSAYAVIILGANYGVSLWLGFVAGIVTALIGAAAIGFFCVRVRGIPFLMLTMAFSQLIYSVALKWRDFTGGSDGIGGVTRPSLLSWSLYDSNVMYGVVLVFFLAAFFALSRLVDSPLGRSFIGIRETKCACVPWAVRSSNTSSCLLSSVADLPDSPAVCTPSLITLSHRMPFIGPCRAMFF